MSEFDREKYFEEQLASEDYLNIKIAFLGEFCNHGIPKRRDQCINVDTVSNLIHIMKCCPHWLIPLKEQDEWSKLKKTVLETIERREKRLNGKLTDPTTFSIDGFARSLSGKTEEEYRQMKLSEYRTLLKDMEALKNTL